MPEEIFLRKATLDDAEVIFNLFNDETVRKNAINPKNITWEEHIAWFSDKIVSKDTQILLAYTSQNEFIGQVRFDLDENSSEQKENWVISIDLIPIMRGKGFASKILEKALDETKIENAYAYIKKENLFSQKMFKKVEFKKMKALILHGKEFYLFARTVCAYIYINDLSDKLKAYFEQILYTQYPSIIFYNEENKGRVYG